MTNKTYTKATMPEKFTLKVKASAYTYSGTYNKQSGIMMLVLQEEGKEPIPYTYHFDNIKRNIDEGWWIVTPIEEEPQDSTTALPEKWKINIDSFADENHIELDVAHTIVQKWLFEQGYGWWDEKVVKFKGAYFLTNTYDCGTVKNGYGILHGGSLGFYENPAKEVKLSISLKIDSVEPETIEYNGLKYNKQAFEEAIRDAGLEPLE